MNDKIRAAADAVAKEFTDKDLLIEAGFASLKVMALPPDAPEIQVREMRMAFFAGAQHLFGSLMGILDPGEEPTDDDLKRLDLIDKELQAFIQEFELRHLPTEGRA
jgi:hypothetical protein